MIWVGKRSCRFEVRLTKEEYGNLIEKARKAGLSSGALVRKAVQNAVIREAPALDTAVLILKLRKVEKYLEGLVQYIEIDRNRPVPPDLREAFEAARDVEKTLAGIYEY